MKKYISAIILTIIITSVFTMAIAQSYKNIQHKLTVSTGSTKVSQSSSSSSSSQTVSSSQSSSSFSESSESVSTATEPAATKNGFTIILKDNMLYVHSGGSKDIVDIYPVSEKMLPKEDRERLYKGISVESESELQQFIEDYTS